MASIVFQAYADSPTPDLGIKIIPGKIMANAEGVVEVYSNTHDVPVEKLIATSSDPSVVQIIGIDQDATHMVSTVKIKTFDAGDARIALAAPGFSSNEFDLTVYPNSNIATKLMMKATPTTYATNGPQYGYIAVESTNDNGAPTPVTSDMPVSISTPDNNIVTPKDNTLLIKKGDYYAIGQIVVNREGTAQLSASSPSMQSVSTTITVNNVNPQNTVQVYVYPKTINAYAASSAYAIVQLHDASGNPILAKNDIPVKVQVVNASGVSTINTSNQSPLFQVGEQTLIKKGTYWSYVPIEVTAGTSGVFNVVATATGSLVSPPVQLTSDTNNTLLDTKSVRLDSLPILATGQKELIGVVHLEDPSGKLLVAKDNIKIQIDSSDTSVVSVSDLQMEKGSQSALVYAQVGNTANPVTLDVVTENPQTVTQTITSLADDSSSLKAEPLLTKVLTHTQIPIAYYVSKDGALGYPSGDLSLMVSPSDTLQTDTLSVHKDQPILISNGVLLKDGIQNLSVISTIFSSTFSIEGEVSSQKSMVLDYPDQIIAGIPNTFSIELLDNQQMPTYSSHDVDIKLVSSDPSVIEMPESVKINSGSYFTTFTVNAKNEGTSEISLLADEIPMSKFDVSVMSITPDVTIQSPDFGESGVPLSVEITALYKQSPVNGLKVDWKVDGGQIQNMASQINSDGKAKMTFIANSAGQVHIVASVSGGLYKITTSSKDVTINAPLTAANSPDNTQKNSLPILGGVNPLMLLIPVVAGIGILIFKKREMFEELSEKLNLSEMIAELKEKVSKKDT
ncbi:MAG: hypothetical protein KGI28_07235 [Thaumarchaeota archaeon]|nr:hypothetical protein [Nitrososphaerota archaeon]